MPNSGPLNTHPLRTLPAPLLETREQILYTRHVYFGRSMKSVELIGSIPLGWRC
jgi:hypothetical protein